MIASATNITADLKKLSKASRKLVRLTDETIHKILNELADLTLENTAYILAENQKDLDRMDPQDPKYDRLLLNEARLVNITEDIRKVASLPSPLNKTLENSCLLYTSPSPRDATLSRMPSSA